MTEVELCVQSSRALLHTRFGDYLFAISLTFLPCLVFVHDFFFSLTDLNVIRIFFLLILLPIQTTFIEKVY